MVKNSFLTSVLGDFKPKLSNQHNSDRTTYEGSRTDGATSQFGLEQITKEPTHITGIFRTHENLVREYEVYSLLHSKCHYYMTFAKFSFKILYLSPYEREAWHYQKANVEQIRLAISECSRGSHFANINVNEQLQFFTQAIQNIIYYYISHETYYL